MRGGRAGAAVLALLVGVMGGQATGVSAALPDGRGWEMVSPVEKNGGQIDPAGAIMGGGVLQAAEDGASITYGSAASFGAGAEGAPPASQYISRRGGAGWSAENVTTPLFSSSYGAELEGVPYRIFSPDLARALLLNGHRCRGEAGSCAVANPPLAGTDAPTGYQNYYLRTSAPLGFEALLASADIATLALGPAEFELALAGVSPDLRHVVISTCAALTPDAIEVPLGEGCDPDEPNLYLRSAGAGLNLINLLPGDTVGTPGAVLAAPARAISADAGRVYWNDAATGNLYLREGGQTKRVDEAAGGGGDFEVANADGQIAYFTAGGHLWRYDGVTEVSVDLTPAGGVEGVLGASADGEYVYYLSATGLFVWNDGATTEVAADADAFNYPPATGSARVSADGTRLAFVATPPLTAYDNTEAKAAACGDPGLTGDRCSEVYLYDAVADTLTCPSCKVGKGRPIGAATLPAASANGEGPNAVRAYKPRALSANGRRLFFDTRDNLATGGTNNDWDVYQWEAQGEGDCGKAAGCQALISSGRSEDGASFVDASLSGDDVFFLTDGSLVGADPGSVDLYDARVGGGFTEPEAPIPCEGNACQSLPPEPVDPPLGTTLAGLGNPPARYSGTRKRCKKGKVRRKGKCVRRGARR